MKTIIQLSLLFPLFLSLTLAAQQNDEFIYFNKTFFGDTMNIISTIGKPISDGYIIIGSYGTTETNYIYVRKIDYLGNTIWIKNLDNELESDIEAIERGTQCFVSEDDFVYLTYPKNSFDGNMFDIQIFKLDFEGNVIWAEAIEGPNNEGVRHIIPTSDGGLMLAGERWFEEPVPSRMYFAKTTSEGVLEWDTTYAHNWGSAFSIQQTWWDDGYIVGGYSLTDSTTLLYDSHVLKLDSDGNLEWDKIFGEEGYDYTAQVLSITTEETFSGLNDVEYCLFTSYEIEGVNVNNPAIAKLSSTGNIKWQRTYHEEIEDMTSFITKPFIKNNKIIANGLVRNQANKRGNLFLEFELETGNILNSNYFNLDSTKSIYLVDMQPTSNNGYLLTGYQYSPPQKAGY